MRELIRSFHQPLPSSRLASSWLTYDSPSQPECLNAGQLEYLPDKKVDERYLLIPVTPEVVLVQVLNRADLVVEFARDVNYSYRLSAFA